MQVEVPVFKLIQGAGPLVVSMPHVGTYLPRWLQPRLTDAARQVADTDWHLEALYDFLHELDATVLIATHSRYVIDLNRPPDNTNLYPGQNTTGLCPFDTFDELPLYVPGQMPKVQEIQARTEHYWKPYHQTLMAELARVRQQHGHAMLWDAHSIQSIVPRFFDGELPHLNIGSADNQSCAAELCQAVAQAALSSPFSAIVNGRFKGGYITRHYGKPESSIHAIQLELAMRSYMQESAPYDFDEKLAAACRPTLKAMMQAMLDWSKKHYA